jgi:hypothetical protein
MQRARGWITLRAHLRGHLQCHSIKGFSANQFLLAVVKRSFSTPVMWDGEELEPDIILGTTLGTHGAIVIVQEPPNPLHPIGFLLCFQPVTLCQMF